ncbi:MAG: hypothetical protein ACTSR2_03585 [Candidatus Hodarchaeales archaeon]
MISLEKRALIGEVESKLYGPDGLLRSYRKSKNLTVNIGFQQVCDMMGKTSGQPLGFQYCAIGTGTIAPSSSDTLLASETARVQGGYTRTADTIWKNDATFGAGTGTGAITESGLFNNSGDNSQTMLCRQTFGTITKGASDTLVITWQYTLS